MQEALCVQNIKHLIAFLYQSVLKISDNLMHQLRDASKDFLWYSLALDESTVVLDTAQLLVFKRGINTRFELTK